jgi:hypothetical protein
MGVPWRVAFALQADGWWLRQDIIWAKPNPMPESTRDRCTKAHEYLFLLTKSERYFYDADAISRGVANPDTPARAERGRATTTSGRMAAPAARPSPRSVLVPAARGARTASPATTKDSGRPWPEAAVRLEREPVAYEGRRNKRSVWTVATEAFKEAHFATYPQKLIEPCILAGSPGGGLVLDPFGGSGTTGLVAARLGRDAILIELNPEYAALADRRLRAGLGPGRGRMRRRSVRPPAVLGRGRMSRRLRHERIDFRGAAAFVTPRPTSRPSRRCWAASSTTTPPTSGSATSCGRALLRAVPPAPVRGHRAAAPQGPAGRADPAGRAVQPRPGVRGAGRRPLPGRPGRPRPAGRQRPDYARGDLRPGLRREPDRIIGGEETAPGRRRPGALRPRADRAAEQQLFALAETGGVSRASRPSPTSSPAPWHGGRGLQPRRRPVGPLHRPDRPRPEDRRPAPLRPDHHRRAPSMGKTALA